MNYKGIEDVKVRDRVYLISSGNSVSIDEVERVTTNRIFLFSARLGIHRQGFYRTGTKYITPGTEVCNFNTWNRYHIYPITPENKAEVDEKARETALRQVQKVASQLIANEVRRCSFDTIFKIIQILGMENDPPIVMLDPFFKPYLTVNSVDKNGN